MIRIWCGKNDIDQFAGRAEDDGGVLPAGANGTLAVGIHSQGKVEADDVCVRDALHELETEMSWKPDEIKLFTQSGFTTIAFL